MNKFMYEILKQQISICRSFKPVQYLVALSCQLLRQLASHLSKLQELLLKQLGVKFLIWFRIHGPISSNILFQIH